MTGDKDKKGDIGKLKRDYAVLKQKYSLPEYSALADDFHSIERASDVETDYLLREIRRYVAEKLFNFHRFVEALLNPSNVPMYIFSMIKTLGADDKKKLSDIYKEIAKMEIEGIKLDLDYSEKKEAEFIKECFAKWQIIKKDFFFVLEAIKKNWDAKADEGKRDYFG